MSAAGGGDVCSSLLGSRGTKMSDGSTDFPAARKYRQDLARTHYNLGNLLKDLGRKEEAEKEYREAIRSDPDDAAAHYNLAILLNSLSRTAEAEAEFGEAMRINPELPPPPGSEDAEAPPTLDSLGTESAS